MTQELASYILLLMAVIYVGKRLYDSIKKKSACEKCALMEATKTPSQKK